MWVRAAMLVSLSYANAARGEEVVDAGLNVMIAANEPTVITCTRNSPAWLLGIRAGDVVVEVNGEYPRNNSGFDNREGQVDDLLVRRGNKRAAYRVPQVRMQVDYKDNGDASTDARAVHEQVRALHRCLSGDCEAGTGEMEFGGVRYAGRFVHGLLVKGTLTFPAGAVYEGEVANEVPHGDGTMRYASGNVYVGELAWAKPGGNGVLTWASGRVYEGEFADGEPVTSTIRYPDGLVYKGSISDWEPHGRYGELRFPDGRRMVGAWEQGEAVGEHVHTSPTGDKHTETHQVTPGVSWTPGQSDPPVEPGGNSDADFAADPVAAMIVTASQVAANAGLHEVYRTISEQGTGFGFKPGHVYVVGAFVAGDVPLSAGITNYLGTTKYVEVEFATFAAPRGGLHGDCSVHAPGRREPHVRRGGGREGQASDDRHLRRPGERTLKNSMGGVSHPRITGQRLRVQTGRGAGRAPATP